MRSDPAEQLERLAAGNRCPAHLRSGQPVRPAPQRAGPYQGAPHLARQGEVHLKVPFLPMLRGAHQAAAVVVIVLRDPAPPLAVLTRLEPPVHRWVIMSDPVVLARDPPLHSEVTPDVHRVDSVSRPGRADLVVIAAKAAASVEARLALTA